MYKERERACAVNRTGGQRRKSTCLYSAISPWLCLCLFPTPLSIHALLHERDGTVTRSHLRNDMGRSIFVNVTFPPPVMSKIIGEINVPGFTHIWYVSWSFCKRPRRTAAAKLDRGTTTAQLLHRAASGEPRWVMRCARGCDCAWGACWRPREPAGVRWKLATGPGGASRLVAFPRSKRARHVDTACLHVPCMTCDSAGAHAGGRWVKMFLSLL